MHFADGKGRTRSDASQAALKPPHVRFASERRQIAGTSVCPLCAPNRSPQQTAHTDCHALFDHLVGESAGLSADFNHSIEAWRCQRLPCFRPKGHTSGTAGDRCTAGFLRVILVGSTPHQPAADRSQAPAFTWYGKRCFDRDGAVIRWRIGVLCFGVTRAPNRCAWSCRSGAIARRAFPALGP